MVLGVGGHTVGVLRNQLCGWLCAGCVLVSRGGPVPGRAAAPCGVVGGVGLLFEIWIVDASIERLTSLFVGVVGCLFVLFVCCVVCAG